MSKTYWPGVRVGRLLVIAEAGHDASGRRLLTCQCDCGTTKTMRANNLTSIRSCGCLLREVRESGSARLTHGYSRTPTWKSWTAMRQRCSNSNAAEYPRYGGRGITVCERWHVFENFLADMGERPDGLSLDRIDNNGNYEPGNCRWATDAQQVQNQRRTKMTPDIVRQVRIKHATGMRARELAALYGVPKHCVEFVLRGKTWASIQ